MEDGEEYSVNLLDNEDVKIRVSSTLDKSVGKKCLTDGSPETCWTSQQGLPQFIHITFPSPVVPKKIHFTFQGGFVGKRCAISALKSAPEDTEDAPSRKLKHLTTVYPEDVNRKQSFDLPQTGAPVEAIRLLFEESSDFFGRITVYDLQMEGHNG